MNSDSIATLASCAKYDGGKTMNNSFLKAIRDAFTDPNSYICLTKVAGVVLLICGIVGYFLGKDPSFMVVTGISSLGVGKALDATVKPETPEQAAK
jgi:hypothetical protein